MAELYDKMIGKWNKEGSEIIHVFLSIQYEANAYHRKQTLYLYLKIEKQLFPCWINYWEQIRS